MITKEELIKRWEVTAQIENEIADVFNKNGRTEEFEKHLEIARTWRTAVAELRDLDDEQGIPSGER